MFITICSCRVYFVGVEQKTSGGKRKINDNCSSDYLRIPETNDKYFKQTQERITELLPLIHSENVSFSLLSFF